MYSSHFNCTVYAILFCLRNQGSLVGRSIGWYLKKVSSHGFPKGNYILKCVDINIF